MNLKQLIRDECANYFHDGHPASVKDWCEARDRRCVVLVDAKRCGYFETALLPAYPDMAGEYAGFTEQKREITVTRQAICPVCGEAFRTPHNRQQYCSEECAEAGKRAKTKDRVCRHRSGNAAPVS